jgi:hypothetical protein
MRKAIRICVFLKSYFSYFFDAICKSGPFYFLVLEVSVYVLILWGRFFINFGLYSIFCSVNHRIIVTTVQCDSICRHLLLLHVSVS